jgi:hypothetical protein
MTPHENELPHDDDLRALYRQLPAEEPQAQTDDAIRAAARRAVAAAPRHSAPAWRGILRWQVPVAVAATLLLTLVIVREEPAQYSALQNAPMVASEHAAERASEQVAESRLDAAAAAPASPPAVIAGSADSAAAASPEALAEIVPVDMAVATSAGNEALVNSMPAPAAASPPAVADVPAWQRHIPSSSESAGSSAGIAKREVAARSAMASRDDGASLAAQSSEQDAPRTASAPAVGISWPFGLLPSMSNADACAQLRRRGVQLADGCANGAGDAADDERLKVFVLPVHDRAGFLQELASQLQATGWQAGPEQVREGAVIRVWQQASASNNGIATLRVIAREAGPLTLELNSPAD